MYSYFKWSQAPMRAEQRSDAGPAQLKEHEMVRPPGPAPTGTCRAFTLEERDEELVNRFKRKAAQDHQRAQKGQSDASYHYGLAAAFEVVAAMLTEVLTEAAEREG